MCYTLKKFPSAHPKIRNINLDEKPNIIHFSFSNTAGKLNIYIFKGEIENNNICLYCTVCELLGSEFLGLVPDRSSNKTVFGRKFGFKNRTCVFK